MTWRRPQTLRRRPTVSVVVPCYRYGHYLAQAVGSVLEQADVDVEVIIVDDASPDDSAQVARSIADADDRVSLIVNATNQGHIATYNVGLGRITGDYVVLLSADDMLAPGALGRAAALMEMNSDVGFVYGWPKNFSTKPEADKVPEFAWSTWSGEDWLNHVCRQGRSFIMSPEVVMRRSVFDSVGGYDPRLPHSADMDLWCRAALVAGVGRVNGPPQAYYRVHESNMHLTVYAGMLPDLVARRTTFAIFFDEHAEATARNSALSQLARCALARDALRMARRELLETRGAGLELARELETFARETVPESEIALAWRWHRHALPLTRYATGRVGAGAAGRVARSLRWRRWRFGGIG